MTLIRVQRGLRPALGGQIFTRSMAEGLVVADSQVPFRHRRRTSSDSLVLADSAIASTGGEGEILLDDNFSDRNTGAISMTSPWTSKGYIDGQFDTCTILDRAGITSAGHGALLADGNFPADKTRVFRVTHVGGDQGEGRVKWGMDPLDDIRDMYVSWWEYRPNSNRAGEKWLRFGSPQDGNRIHDIIWYLGSAGENTFGVLYQGQLTFDDVGMTPFTWDGTLSHFECRMKKASGANVSDGIFQAWKDGVQIANETNVFTDETSGQVDEPWQLVELGGWSSGSGTYPVNRYICHFRVATGRQGVWAMT